MRILFSIILIDNCHHTVNEGRPEHLGAKWAPEMVIVVKNSLLLGLIRMNLLKFKHPHHRPIKRKNSLLLFTIEPKNLLQRLEALGQLLAHRRIILYLLPNGHNIAFLHSLLKPLLQKLLKVHIHHILRLLLPIVLFASALRHIVTPDIVFVRFHYLQPPAGLLLGIYERLLRFKLLFR